MRRSVYRHDQMKRLVAPESVAIVGLSQNPASFGARTAANMRRFSGRLWGVNPRGGTIHEVETFPFVREIPERIDCAVVAVPMESVENIVVECAEASVGGCIIYASGFAETAREDRIAAQERIVAIGREADMRIAGPNCFGLINNLTGAGMSFSGRYGAAPTARGPVAIVSQSGGLAQAIAQVTERGGGWSHYLATGNSADVDVCDYVSYLSGDDGCRVITCIAEGLRDGERLLEAAEIAAAANKPIVMYKIATGCAGAKAAMSHTGALAGSSAAYEAAFRRAGIIGVDAVEDLYPTAAFLAKAGKPKAMGTAAIAASGGSCVIALDKAETAAVAMPRPAPETLERLRRQIPDYGSVSNPCDITAGVAADGDAYAECAKALLEDPGYGVLVVMAPSISESMTPRNVALFSKLARETGKPVCLSWMSEWLDGPGAREAEADEHVALFKSTGQCFRAIADWHEWARDREPTRPRRAEASERAARSAALLLKAGAKLSERQAGAILTCYGIPVVENRIVRDGDEAVRAAQSLGFPVVLKADTKDVAHKSEAGLVRIGLANDDAVRESFEQITAASSKMGPHVHIDAMVVQPMAANGVELVVGAKRDPTFGPMVVVGFGGVLVELLDDVAAELAPVTKHQALAMLQRLKGRKLLAGYRGSDPVDIDSVAEIVVAVSELAADHSDTIAEIDVNPLICGAGGAIAVDALIIRAPLQSLETDRG